MKRAHTVEKIGGTSMTCFGDVMKNVIIGRRKGSELYNRIFVVSAYGGVTNRLLEDKKTGEPGIYGHFAMEDGKWEEKTGRNPEVHDRFKPFFCRSRFEYGSGGCLCQ